MEDRRKRSPGQGEEEERESSPAAKRQRREDERDDVGADIMAWLSMEEYEEEEEDDDDRLILELLEAEKSCTAAEANKVRFSENPYHRTSPASVFQTTPSSYVTINGNEESCGSSFSDWDSSVMASVDMAGLAAAAAVAGSGLFGMGLETVGKGFAAEMDGAWGELADEEFGGEWGGLDLDDGSLAGFLGEIFPEQSQE